MYLDKAIIISEYSADILARLYSVSALPWSKKVIIPNGLKLVIHLA